MEEVVVAKRHRAATQAVVVFADPSQSRRLHHDIASFR